jgi:hypothetical protein
MMVVNEMGFSLEMSWHSLFPFEAPQSKAIRLLSIFILFVFYMFNA